MGLEVEYIFGQTPIDDEEKEGILISSITTRGELNEFEQLNIEEAIEWILKRRFTRDQILKEEFIKTIHYRMLGKVWKWAGEFRKSEKNIGVGWIKIGMELRYLLDNTKYWIDHQTYPPDEIAIRFKHNLVQIHCFPNGNGRHSRIMADIIIESIFSKEAFSWGHSNMVQPNDTRKKYINAIIQADKGDIHPLLDFARS